MILNRITLAAVRRKNSGGPRAQVGRLREAVAGIQQDTGWYDPWWQREVARSSIARLNGERQACLLFVDYVSPMEDGRQAGAGADRETGRGREDSIVSTAIP